MGLPLRVAPEDVPAGGLGAAEIGPVDGTLGAVHTDATPPPAGLKPIWK